VEFVDWLWSFFDYKLLERTELITELTVRNLCTIVPEILQKDCNDLMNNYGEKMIGYLDKTSNPEKICELIKVCEKKEPKKPDIEPSKLIDNESKVANGTLECTLCLYVAQIVDSMLKQNKTEEEIVKELEKICTYFPTSLKNQCNAFLDEYGPYVIQLLAADLDPQQTCTALKLCDKSLLVTSKFLHPNHHKSFRN